MPNEIGRKVYTGIGKETTKGTAVSPTYWPDFSTHNLNPKTERVVDESAHGQIESGTESHIVKKWSEPAIGGPIRDQSIGLMLLVALGQVSTTANTPEAGVHTHDFTVKNDNDHPALTIVGKDGNMTKSSAYSMLNTMSIEMITGEYAKYDATFIGKSLATDTETEATISENLFVPRHAVVKLAANLAGLDAAGSIKVMSFKININKNASAHYASESDEPEAIINGTYKVAGDMELRFTDTTYLDLFLSDTKKAFRLTLENTDVTIGASTNPKVEFDLARVAVSDWGRTEDNDGVITQTIGFDAEFSISDTKMMTAKLINTVASY